MNTIPIHVAVGVVFNQNGDVLVALRSTDVDQGGLWEFPGGKVEAGETTLQALTRELLEEVNITVEEAAPLVMVNHTYPNKRVLLDVWQVTQFSGEPKAIGGQQLVRWVTIEELPQLAIPAANHPIVQAVLERSNND